MGAITNVTQTAFRVKNDTGGETSTDWRDALNTNSTAVVGEKIRIRFNVNGAGGSGASITPQLSASKDGGANFNVTTGSSDCQAADSAGLTDGGVTTEQLAQAGTFVAGEVIEDGRGALHAINTGEDIEHEFVVTFSAAGSYALKILNDSSDLTGGYTQTPTIVVSAVAEQDNLLTLGCS